MDRLRTRPGRAVLVAPVGPALDRAPAQAQGDRVDPVAAVTDRVARVDLADPVARVDLADRMGRAVLGDQVVRVDLGRVVPEAPASLGVRERVRTDPVALADRVDRLNLAVPAARVSPVDLVGQANLAVPAGLAGMDLQALAAPVARRRPRTCSAASSTGAAPSGVVLATYRTASAPQAMVRRHLRSNTDSAGTVDLLPERRHPSGTAHRLRAAGTDRRLPAAGIPGGSDRRATLVGRRLITGHSTTTDTTPFRCSTRSSVDGAFGSSVSGFRCTDPDSTDA